MATAGEGVVDALEVDALEGAEAQVRHAEDSMEQNDWAAGHVQELYSTGSAMRSICTTTAPHRMLARMSISRWIDPYRPGPCKQLSVLPESGRSAALGVCLADGEARGAVIVLPGGSYLGLAEHEGPAVARFIRDNGIHAFVLRYRHAPHARHPLPLEDARRAVRLIRHGAAEGWWPVDARKIAVLGFSAGGHLAAVLATDAESVDWAAADPVDRHSARPDAQMLAYPVIRLSGHAGCRNALLGSGASEEMARSLDADQRVTPQTPPAFIFHTANDPSVPVGNALSYASALAGSGVRVDLHIFAEGPHGVGLADEDEHLRAWPWLMIQWLRHMGW